MLSRRGFLCATGAGFTLAACGAREIAAQQTPGERPKQDARAQVMLPRLRVPVSLIIDDSTCLVNLNRFAIPQFAAAWNHDDKYKQDWRTMPHEIPDDFVREFVDWCDERGVKGKYSIVPFPACVGRLDREIPGWTQPELAASIRLVQERVMKNWDIHPEMVTHTRVIDTKTGHPYPDISPRLMENWDWTTGRTVDEIAEYIRYALTILKNVDLPCDGITTPGGFGNKALPQLSMATLQACRDVFRAEIPHYFRHLYDSGERSVAPRVEYAAGLDTDDPRCAVSIIGCTSDWTGGWDCSDRGHLDRFITPNLKMGRLVEVIERGEPAILVCHWTGIYFNGEKVGFTIFQEVVRRLHERFDHLVWMKLSEIARYWAAKELTAIERTASGLQLRAPFACPAFTLRIAGATKPPHLVVDSKPILLEPVSNPRQLSAGRSWVEKEAVTICFDLPKGRTELRLQ